MRTPHKLVGSAFCLALVSQLAACGTIFYPERRGQISGKIDPAIAVMDAIGLLFYIIPGLLAFAVDFITGAIYLPGGKHAQVDPALLQKAINPDGSIDNLRLKTIIEEQTGHSLPLDNPSLLQQRGNLQQLASLGLRPTA
ncbi:polyribonucleotide nucleotidyltransferase [Pseudomonas sp. N040]|uniref:polyribonucleotide nucleotidyltransferase n=1 Tax=Pseudomonas sp. N040 TaxID=2785325 RepID=UPI0018A32A4A|nr:polyribonucleotide nucleotidyltransferase [Pseudomonas sp. N040]MBF7730952.1 polyribonucleotide nucleotidyltransferase [Pseudomonas sp. N040]MBW7014595.1 polyribonucleotide nucleotidyltransferase [Pseudomonas sp. N040]